MKSSKQLCFELVRELATFSFEAATIIQLYQDNLLLLATLALFAEGWLGAPRPAQGRFRTSYLVKRISYFASRLRRAS